MNKVLTIIIPSYNMEKYIESCCKSLLVEESFLKKIEIIIVNDGSKDNTSILAHKFQEEYPDTFIVIDKENGNYGSCINTGLKIAKGKYIKILDADDTFNTKNFQNFIFLLENTDVDLVISDFIQVDPDGNIINEIKYPFENSKVLDINNFSKNIINSFSMHAVTYKIENIKQLSYFQSEGISYTDQEWIFLPMFNSKTFIYFNKTLYKYLVGRDGQTVNPDTRIKSIAMEIKVTKKIIQDYIDHKNEIINKTFIENKLIERCSVIYHFYLIEYFNYVNFDDLIEYDNYLKDKLKNIYDLILNNKEKPNFKYIKCWRKHNTNNTLSFKIYYFYRRLYFFIHKILHIK